MNKDREDISNKVLREKSKEVSRRFIEAIGYCIALHLRDIYTEKDFAYAIGILPQNLARIKRGTHYSTVDMLVNTCLLFNVSSEWLLLGKGDVFTPKVADAIAKDTFISEVLKISTQ